MLSDFPKIYCPFIRQPFPVNKDQWKKAGSRLQLRKPEVYLAVNRVSPGYEWVFEDPETIAVEKLNGSNVKLLTEAGRLLAVQNSYLLMLKKDSTKQCLVPASALWSFSGQLQNL